MKLPFGLVKEHLPHIAVSFGAGLGVGWLLWGRRQPPLSIQIGTTPSGQAQAMTGLQFAPSEPSPQASALRTETASVAPVLQVPFYAAPKGTMAYRPGLRRIR